MKPHLILRFSAGELIFSKDKSRTCDRCGEDGKTEVTLRSLFPSAEALQTPIQQYEALECGSQHLASLAAYLESLG